jgi:hypothetical protein
MESDPKTRSPERIAEIAMVDCQVIYRWISLELVPYTEEPPRSGNFKLPLNVFEYMGGLPTDLETLSKLSEIHEPGTVYVTSDELLNRL